MIGILIDGGKIENKVSEKEQKKVTDATASIARQMGAKPNAKKDGKEGEAKDAKGDPKNADAKDDAKDPKSDQKDAKPTDPKGTFLTRGGSPHCWTRSAGVLDTGCRNVGHAET